MEALSSGRRYRFGQFSLDLSAFELRRNGRPVRLERQPMDLLILLVERQGALVSRAEIVDRLWGPDVFVDVDTGVHTAIRKVRQALGDSPQEPNFIATVPGRGYRFVAPVEVEADTGTAAGDARTTATTDLARSPAAADAVTTASDQVAEEPPEQRAVPIRPALRDRIPARAFGALGLGLLAVVVAAGIARWSRPAAPGADPSVRLAVLPFANLSGDPAHDYIADGLAEEMIASLGQVDPDRLSVIARTSTLVYRGTTMPVSDIGREIGADYLLESSLRFEAPRLRITSRLIRARDAVQVWSGTYDREPTSLLGFQQELSAAIAQGIRVRLSSDGVERVARRQPRSPEAYDLYLRGRNFEQQRTPETNRQAIEHYQRATTIDPAYALAWSGMAMVYAASPINSDTPPLEVCPLARQAAMQAVDADATLAEAQFAAGYVRWMCDWDWPDAEARLRRAIALDGQLSSAHFVLGHVLSQMGRHGEALVAAERARLLEPMEPMTHAMSSQIVFQARDFRAAIEHGRQAIVINPGFWIGQAMLGQAYEQLGELESALEAATLASRFSGQNSKLVALRGYALARSGRLAEARSILQALVSLAETRYVPPYAMALISMGLGDRDAAFTWLDRARAVRDVHLMFLTADPKWDALRDEPRFATFIADCGFASTETAETR